MLKPLLLLVFAVFSLQAPDDWVGTWKLDPTHSEFVNTNNSKDMTLVITEDAGYHVLKFTIIAADGKVVHQDIKQPNKGGKLIPIGNTQVENGVLEVPNDHEWIYRYYSNDGKPEATRYVRLSKDGKTVEADMRGMRNGKKFIDHEVTIKQ